MPIGKRDGPTLSAAKANGDGILSAGDIVLGMARLADDAYKQSANAAIDDGWHALTAGELGITTSGSGSVKYTFDEGVYRGKAHGSSEGQALALTGSVDGDTILTLAFRGTVDLVRQYQDYFPFNKHYASFKPLIAAVKDFVDDGANGVDRVIVSGHSLGGAMAQLFLNENFHVPVSGYTFGSPGAEGPTAGAKLLNFAHSTDLAPVLGEVDNDRAGGIVTIDKNGLSGITPPHTIENYVRNVRFLVGEAKDEDSPFHSDKLAEALRTGDNYGRHIRLEVGTDERDILKPFTEDRYSLAGDGKDQFRMRESELIQWHRELDGGDGKDSVKLPHNRTRSGDGVVFRVNERDDGSTVLKYDTKTGSSDLWKTVGVFYRTETIIYANGNTEPLAEHAKLAPTADDGDLILI